MAKLQNQKIKILYLMRAFWERSDERHPLTVADLIADRVGPTLSLAGFTIVLTVLIAVPLGAWAAYRQGGWVDRALMGFSVLGFSIPSFVLGYCFVWLFGLKLNLLPSQG